MTALQGGGKEARNGAFNELGIASNMLSMAELCAKEKAGLIG